MHKTNNFQNSLKILFSGLFVFFIIISLTLPIFIQAQDDSVSGNTGGNSVVVTTPSSSGLRLINPFKVDNLMDFWREILKIAAQIGSIFVVVGFVYTGFLFVKSRGNAEELQVAKRSFAYTVIGAALVLGAWAFSVAISETIKSITS